jgi:hypothetical protein
MPPIKRDTAVHSLATLTGVVDVKQDREVDVGVNSLHIKTNYRCTETLIMKKLLHLAAVTTTLVSLSAAPAFAESAKNAMSVSGVALIQPTTQTEGWQPILNAAIHTAQQKDLIAGASLETGLYTQTQVRGKNGSTDTASANAQIEVRVLVDLYADGKGTATDESGGNVSGFDLVAAPGHVVFDKRLQSLSATLGGVLESCSDTNLDGTIDLLTECTVTDEQIDLLSSTMAAHHFNFVIPNLPSGTHRVVLQARISSASSSVAGSASANGLIGKGAFTVEEVRAVNVKRLPGLFTFSM